MIAFGTGKCGNAFIEEDELEPDPDLVVGAFAFVGVDEVADL